MFWIWIICGIGGLSFLAWLVYRSGLFGCLLELFASASELIDDVDLDD